MLTVLAKLPPSGAVFSHTHTRVQNTRTYREKPLKLQPKQTVAKSEGRGRRNRTMTNSDGDDDDCKMYKIENVMKTAGRLRPTVPTRPIGKLNGLKNRRCTVGPQVKWENIAQIEVLCFSKHLKTCIYCSIIDYKIQALAW